MIEDCERFAAIRNGLSYAKSGRFAPELSPDKVEYLEKGVDFRENPSKGGRRIQFYAGAQSGVAILVNITLLR